MKRKFISKLLAICLVISVLPVQVFAADGLHVDKLDAQSGLPFTDVPKSEWYYDAVSYVYENSLFMGTSETTFEPEVVMTRAMLVQVLANNTSNYDANKYKQVGYSDVKTSDWFGPAVEWARQNNIAVGTGDNKFSPNDTITREQMATILYRYASLTGNEVTYTSGVGKNYSDWGNVSTWAQESMEWAISNKVLEGYNGNLTPVDGARRCEVAQVFLNSKDILTKSELPELEVNSIFSQIPNEFIFSSGVGGWATIINISSDGTFSGEYYDYDMGVTGAGYPNGTKYECMFYGKFTSVEKINEYEYSMKIDYIIQEEASGKEYLRDDFRIITSDPYGFDDADDFRLYLPGKKISELPYGFISWAYSEMYNTVLSCYGLYNVAGEQGFTDYDSFLR